jgi:hypothetical protein
MSSAHQVGCSGWSERKRERLRQAVLEQRRQQQHEREAYLQGLADKLVAECGLSQATALARVKALSVSANPSRRDDRAVRFG